MLRDGWNFHNDIALELEGKACKQYNYPGRPYGMNFDADAIESGSFVEVMEQLLKKRKDSIDDDIIYSFLQECRPYYGVSGNQISPEDAQRLFDEFCEIINEE